MTTPPFVFGQTIYEPWASAHAEERRPCPVCFGNRSVMLILGNGEHVPVECDMCDIGFEGPRAFVTGYSPQSGIRECTVTTLEERYPGKWYVNHQGADQVFATRDEAEGLRQELHAKAVAAAENRYTDNTYQRKKLTWKVGYHRREIADATQRLAWHEARLQDLSNPKTEAV